MLVELFPRAHARYHSLPVLGSRLSGLACWLHEQGFSRLTIRHRMQRAPGLDADLRRRGVRDLGELSRKELLLSAPAKATDNKHLSALVRSLAIHLEALDVLRPPVVSRTDRLADDYREHLLEVRGYARQTADGHASTARQLLSYLRIEDDPVVLRTLGPSRIEAFVKAMSTRQCRATLQNTAARLRSFLVFLASIGEVSPGLDTFVDAPAIYRSELLPRALPWDSVRALLTGIDRSARTGHRDYAMLLLAATYGLRSSEVVGLRLDDFRWRAAEIHVRRPKAGSPLVLPLTDEVGAAMIEYLREARPEGVHRAAFLRVRPPIGPLAPATLGAVFDRWRQHCGIDIPHRGAHCLRHSLAMRLLRDSASLQTIGDILGHRSPASTSVYLRLSAEDLREAALDLPVEEAP